MNTLVPYFVSFRQRFVASEIMLISSRLNRIALFIPRSFLSLGLIAACLIYSQQNCFAFTVLFSENFDTVSLGAPVDENSSISNAFSHDPPQGWNNQISLVPGVGDPDYGVTEWEGWSFANKDFWTQVALPTGGPSFGPRNAFTLGQGTIAVADPDQWNDLGDPANELGFYNSFLSTPNIDLRNVAEDQMKLVFDSAWVGGCCDDGELFDPDGNNQTATLKANLPDGSQIEILRWESAPFYNSQGQPSINPLDTPNPFFKPNNLNERVVIDLSALLAPTQPSSTTGPSLLSLLTPAAAGGPVGVSFEFGMEDAGDDGYWAMDSVELISYTTLLGDMDISGVLDAPDIDAFALGMLDDEEYLFNYFGEFPVSRGSVDGTFDFDDIPWFVGLMEDAGLASASAALAQAFSVSVPEPTGLALFFLASLSLVKTPRKSYR